MSAVAKQVLYLALLVTLTACNDAKAPVESVTQPEKKAILVPQTAGVAETAKVLPYLDAKASPPQFVSPQCASKNCLNLKINTLITQDPWLNNWLSRCQADVLMQQIEQEQKNPSLQHAVNRYAAASQAWQQQSKQHQAFQLDLETALVYQKNGIVLVQMQVNSHQAQTKVKDRLYFFVADRHNQQHLAITDVIDSDYAKTLQDILNQHYKKWLATQSDEVKTTAPQQLAWQQGQWFYDQEGMGLHFRAGQISPIAEQLDIYFTAAQTKRVMKATLYQTLFSPQSTREEPHESKNRAA